MTFFNKAFKTITKQNNFKKFNYQEKIEVNIKRFVSKPCYSTQYDVYAACHSYHPLQSKIILNDELYDSFETTIGTYRKKSTSIHIDVCIICPTVFLIHQYPEQLEIFTTLWFGGFFLFTSFLVKCDIYDRQQFLYEFLYNRIERGENVLSNLTKTSEVIKKDHDYTKF
jgi:hypothetical protein